MGKVKERSMKDVLRIANAQLEAEEREQAESTAAVHESQVAPGSLAEEPLVRFEQVSEDELICRNLGGDPNTGEQDLSDLSRHLRPVVEAACLRKTGALRKVAKSYVEEEAAWRVVANMNRLVRKKLLKQMFPGDQRWRIQAVDRDLKKQRIELAGENPTRAVIMAVENLQIIMLELNALRLRPGHSEDGSHPVDRREIAATEKRYALAFSILEKSLKIAADQKTPT